MDLGEKFRQLQQLGAGEFAHINGSLIEHLRGTCQLLVDWQAPGFVADAGLYHAAYSTAGYEGQLLDLSERGKVAAIIGDKAESLVYLYCACDRAYFYPQIGSKDAVYRDRFTGKKKKLDDNTQRYLLEIIMANELEICRADAAFKEANRAGFMALFDRFKGRVSDQAFASYVSLFQTGA